jgi:hypothetical protein
MLFCNTQTPYNERRSIYIENLLADI